MLHSVFVLFDKHHSSHDQLLHMYMLTLPSSCICVFVLCVYLTDVKGLPGDEVKDGPFWCVYVHFYVPGTNPD